MLTDSQKRKIIQFAKECTAQNDPYHDFEHLKETAENAVMLAEKEGADIEICWTSAMLHDICRECPGNHGTEGGKKAKEFLLGIGTDEEFAEKVREAIYYHNKEFRNGSLERQIVWDADKLTVMTPEGFRKRMVPYWTFKLGEKEGIKKTISEYYFYFERFHTMTARKKVERHKKEMDIYMDELRKKK